MFLSNKKDIIDDKIYTVLLRYVNKCNAPSDIHEHLPTLSNYSEKCDSVIELGMRYVVSTWAFFVVCYLIHQVTKNL